MTKTQRQKRLEVLKAAADEVRSVDWFEGKAGSDTEYAEATADMVRKGLLEKARRGRFTGADPDHYRLTAAGRAFLDNVRATIGKPSGDLAWERVNEIKFPGDAVDA